MITSNYDHIRDTKLPEFRGTGRLFRHRQSGCEIYHLHNDDEENLFAFMFKTVPPDSTGVAHILEHTVLCGSERYPVKDPFLLLLKGSMYTFLNALTFPDKTVYPASSTVAQDLFNLMKVYGDAVFFPLLKEEMFAQEGHRLVMSDDGSLDFSGVVYNEMKGAYSTHDAIAGEMALRSLFPDTAYGHDSGGNPREIPNLSYEQFLDFHRRYYHPSNARIFLYGNIDTEDYLGFLHEEFLNRFSLDDPGAGEDISVDLQPRWSEPRRVTSTYPTDQEETAGMSSVTLNWLIADMERPDEVFACEALADILLGSSGAPLYKALIESGLGEDLSSPTGLETELREVSFSAGLRGTDPERAGEIESLVFETLTFLRDNGIDPDVIEGTLRKMAFSNIERPGSGFGLRLMRRAARSWLHGGEPEDTMCFEEAYSRLRKTLEERPRYFESLIDELLLSNPHRTTLIVEPDRDYERREREAVAEQLREIDAGLDDAARAEVRKKQEALELVQSQPDDPAAVASIPFLTLNDVPRSVERIPAEVDALPGGGTLLRHELDTGGIVYLDLAFDLSAVDEELLAYLPLFATAITDIGLPGESYDSVARRLDLTTGGFSAGVSSSAHLADERPVTTLGVRLKALCETAAEGFGLAFELLRRADFSDHRRLRDLLLEERNDIRSAVVPDGSMFAWTYAASGMSKAAGLRDRFRGVRQLEHMCSIDTDGDLSWLEERFERIRAQVFRCAGVTVALASQDEGLALGEKLVRDFLGSLPAGDGQAQGAADTASERGQAQGAADTASGRGQAQGAADTALERGQAQGAADTASERGQAQG
ncbi:MAG: insulinase family protein, partial [Spirochaetales bacterium]